MKRNECLPLTHCGVLLVLSTILGLSVVGCSPGSIPVSGTVTLDEAPLAEAFVSFTPAKGGRPVSTTTDEAGGFRLDSTAAQGLLSGEYKVTISKTQRIGVPPEVESGGPIPAGFDPSSIKEEWVTPPKYAKTKTSGLSVSVKPGMPPVAFELVSEK